MFHWLQLGVVHHKIFCNETVNAGHFKIFVDELMEKIQNSPELHNSVIIMDNAKIHKEREIKTSITDKGCTLKFLSPYSPMLNPIEKPFSKIKIYAIGMLGNMEVEHNLPDVINQGINQLTSIDCSNYIMDMVFLIPQSSDGLPLH
jgi:NDP-sugar pyrophosphorylase family protein